MEMMKEQFLKNGFVYVPNILDVVHLQEPVPEERGQLTYIRKDKVKHDPIEQQVNGSLSRWNHPKFKESHYTVKQKIEKILDIDLLKTYYYDRFYFVGQELVPHVDRPACEISITIQISSNHKNPWLFWVETPSGEKISIVMNDGDGVIYRGCERSHWREPLESRYNKPTQKLRNLMKLTDDTYHHQVFMHYVNSQGPYVWAANDYIR
jgi:hypothetical protein